MIAIQDNTIVVLRPGRTIPIQPLNDSMRYAALRTFGVTESVAAALIKGLITIKGATP